MEANEKKLALGRERAALQSQINDNNIRINEIEKELMDRSSGSIETKTDTLPDPYSVIKPFSKQILSDLIVTALEGGSNFWYLIKDEADAEIRKYKDSNNLHNNCFSEWVFVALENGAKIQIHDIEDEENLLGTLTIESLHKATRLISEKYPAEYANMLEEDYDADSADIFFQLAVMGEVVYG